MYHQFDRTLHPRQSVLNIIMNMNEQNKQLEEDIKDLKAVSILGCLIKHLFNVLHLGFPQLQMKKVDWTFCFLLLRISFQIVSLSLGLFAFFRYYFQGSLYTRH